MATREVGTDELRLAQSLGHAAHAAGGDYLWARDLGDGRCVWLMAMFGGNLRLAVGVKGSIYFDDGWCYQAEQRMAAWRAAIGWDGEGEPEGWYRHPETGRRRPGGDEAQEYVYP